MQAETMTALTVQEARDLSRYEAIVAKGQSTFLATAQALAQIRDRRLYRQTHKRFEAYCEERWGFTGRRGRQLAQAAEFGTIVPLQNEAQARALAKHPPEDRVSAWDRAAATGTPTAAKLESLLRKDAQSQAEEIRKEEEEVLSVRKEPAEPTEPRSAARDRVNQVRALCGRLKRLHAGLTDVADAADAALDGYLAIVEGTTES